MCDRLLNDLASTSNRTNKTPVGVSSLQTVLCRKYTGVLSAPRISTLQTTSTQHHQQWPWLALHAEFSRRRKIVLHWRPNCGSWANSLCIRNTRPGCMAGGVAVHSYLYPKL